MKESGFLMRVLPWIGVTAAIFGGIVLSGTVLGGCTDPDTDSPPANYETTSTSRSPSVMTFNIRYANPNDGDHIWEFRKDWVAEIIREERPLIVGLQEALRHQIDTLAAHLPGYAWLGVGRSDGANEGEFSPIFYDTDLVEITESGTFWLSESPGVIGSTGWDAALPRIATWARMTFLESGQSFLFVNTHFDHRGEEARLNSAQLLVDWIFANAGPDPVILSGDFNIQDDQPPYTALVKGGLLNDTAGFAGPNEDLTTFRGFEVGSIEPVRIDYIFVTGDVTVEKHSVLADSRNGRYPSDHLPVVVEFTLGDS